MKINVTVGLLTVILVVSGLLGFVGITIREVQAAPPNLLVGGPATSSTTWGFWSGHRGNRTNTVGSLVRYTVNITDVKELWSFDFTLSWGMTVLELKTISLRVNGQPAPGNNYTDGIFTPTSYAQTYKVGETLLLEANRTAIYRCAYAQMGTVAPWNWTSGKGCVVYLDYVVQSPGGECDLYFVSSTLTFKNATQITHNKQEGYFYFTGKKRVPTAGFTISPPTIIANKTSVSFNGGTSSDPDGAGMKSYIWNFGQDKAIIPAIESPHNYPRNVKLNYTFTVTNVIRMRMFFSRIAMGAGDTLRIRDKNNALIQTAPSTATNWWSFWVKGNTININLTSNDDANQGWGFKADHYSCYLQVLSTPTAYTYTILQSDYPGAPQGPYPLTASLSVVDNEDSQSKTVSSSFQVLHPRPIARFTFSPNVTHYHPNVNWAYIFCGETVNFDASSSFDPDPSGGILWYAWDFGDGTKDNRSTPTTSYNFAKQGGIMAVGLTIKDASDGLMGFATYNIRVYNMTEFARAYGSWGGTPPWIPADPNWNYFYDIISDNYITAADLQVVGRSYY